MVFLKTVLGTLFFAVLVALVVLGTLLLDIPAIILLARKQRKEHGGFISAFKYHFRILFRKGWWNPIHF